jgi:hypothetical protein
LKKGNVCTGGLLRGGYNGVFYHAMEAPVENVVRMLLGVEGL